MPKKIDIAKAPRVAGTLYPPPFDEACRKRSRIKLGDAAGLTQFGVNLCRLPPGAWSSQRHWHTHADELIAVVEGEATLVTDDGEEILRPGDCAGFKAGDPNGHCFQNRTGADVVLPEIGTRAPKDAARYSDVDMITLPGRPGYAHRDGTPYPEEKRKAG
jgi:uncharacterized cupin superfamily protein